MAMQRAKWLPGTLVRTFLIKSIYHEMPQALTCITKSFFLMTQEVTFLGTSESSPHPSQRRRIQNKQQNSILVVLTDFR